MESKVQAVFMCRNELAITTLSSILSFNDLLRFVMTKWNVCYISKFSMHYSLPGYANCILSSEDEFISMNYMIAECRVNFVNISVKVYSDSAVGESSGSKSLGSHSINDMEVVPTEACSDVTVDSVYSFGDENVRQLFLSRDWKYLIRGVGQVFYGGMAEFRHILLKFCVANGYKFVYKRNSADRVVAICSKCFSMGCNWRIAASLNNGAVCIKKYDGHHTCGEVLSCVSDGRVTSNLVSSLVSHHVKMSPGTTPTDILKHIKRLYGLNISYEIARNSLEKARDDVFGDMGRSYDKLHHYFDKVKLVDPNSTLELESDPLSGHFIRCFISFGAMFQGFEFCRPVIFLDGTFLTGKYKGQLLAATAKDGNNGLFNVAFAVVGNEDEENWCWFLKHLKVIVGGRTITFISDRCKGLINAVDEIFPFCFHSFCMNHVLQNLKDKFRGSKVLRERMVELLKEMSTAATEEEYKDKYMAAVTEGGDNMIDFMLNLPKEHFAKVYFKGQRYGEMTSNAAESFNSMIKRFKHLPVTELIDQIRRHLMEQIMSRKTLAQKWNSILCPNMMLKYNYLVDVGRSWVACQSSEDMFEVLCGETSFIVDSANRTCTCSIWQHDGFPCAHAIAAFLKGSPQKPFEFIEPYFQSEFYRKCYETSISPVEQVESSRLVGDVVVRPPIFKRPPGRPRKKRLVKKGYIAKKKVKCSRCNTVGRHNRRTCKEPIIE